MTDLEFYEGEDITYPISITENGVAKDITGYTIRFVAKKSINDGNSEAIIIKNITTHSSPIGGITSLSFNHTDTVGKNGKYVYDLQWEDTFSDIRYITGGNLIVKQVVGDWEV